jgi:hypothetical protein
VSLEVKFGAAIEQAGRRWEVDPRLLAAVAAQETGGPGSASGRNVVGDGGHGRGLFQIDDRYHAFARTAAAMDPAQNADYAAHMLHDLLASNGGNVRAALSAYNAGSPDATGTLTTWPDGRTLGYADSVQRHYAQLTDAAVSSPTNSTKDKGAFPMSFLTTLAPMLGSAIGSLGAGASSLALTGAENWFLGQQTGNEIQQMVFQNQLNAQATQFNETMDEKSEIMRESNTLRDVAMEQRKADLSITKEFIRSID